MSDRPISPMDLALALAEDAAAAGEAPVGAVVVEGDTVLAAERNRMRERNDPTAHAELLAIRAALAARGTGRLDGCDLYVTLEPCAMCAGAIVLARAAAGLLRGRGREGGSGRQRRPALRPADGEPPARGHFRAWRSPVRRAAARVLPGSALKPSTGGRLHR